MKCKKTKFFKRGLFYFIKIWFVVLTFFYSLLVESCESSQKNSLSCISDSECGSESICVFSYCKNRDDVNYFPTSLGNKWLYTEGIQAEIVSTKNINGQTTYFIQFSVPDFCPYYRGFYIYSGDNGIYTYGYIDCSEREYLFEEPEMFFKFPAQAGERFSTLMGEELVVSSTDKTVSTPAGDFYHCYLYENSSATCAGIGCPPSMWYLAPEVGIVKIGGNFDITLVSFSIK